METTAQPDLPMTKLNVETSRSVPSINDPDCGFTLIAKSDDKLAEIGSLYSEPVYDDSLKPTGYVRLGVWYNNSEKILYIKIVNASNLVAPVSGKDTNPYIKVHLLPNKSKHTKRRTTIQRNTTSPEFNEVVKVRLAQTLAWVSLVPRPSAALP